MIFLMDLLQCPQPTRNNKNDTNRDVNNNGFIFIYSSFLLDKLVALKIIVQSISFLL